MTSTPGSAPNDGPAVAVPVRRAPMALVTWAFVILVLVIVVVLLVVKVTRGTTAVVPPPVAPAPASVVQAAATVPVSVLDTVGAPAPDGPAPVVLSGQPALVVDGRPAVVYVGSEFCPYCAAARWALVVALSRFGTFDHLGATSSSGAEAFPGIQTFSFDGAGYRSRFVSWSAVEEYGPTLDSMVPAGFALLHRPGALARALMTRYGSGPGSAGTGRSGAVATLPFIDIGNRVLVEGAGIGFSPGALQGVSMAQIATDLSDPTSPVAQAILGTANELTAAVCAATDETPVRVCRSAGVRAGASRLGL
ncbi:MAG TPA: DUF929 family protein [Acidimicrobiales bacterium]|nr:DUF929 family protein [Acidimicrobiales bacterium]